RPGGPGAVEAVEDVGEVLGGDPGPVVPDRDVAPRAQHLDRGPVWAPLEGVVEQVADGPGDPGCPPLDPGRLRVCREGHAPAAPVRGCELDAVIDQLIEAD